MKLAAIGIVVAAVLAAVIAAAVLFTRSDRTPEPEIALELPAQIARPDPLDYAPGRTEEYERAAAFGLSHVLFEKSPGGVVGAAQRTAGFRDLVDQAVSGSGIDADTVEAIVLLESAGIEDVIAGDDPENASGLTQILAETALEPPPRPPSRFGGAALRVTRPLHSGYHNRGVPKSRIGAH